MRPQAINRHKVFMVQFYGVRSKDDRHPSVKHHNHFHGMIDTIFRPALDWLPKWL